MKRLLLIGFLCLVGCRPTSISEKRTLNLPNGATRFLYQGGSDYGGSWYSWEWEGRKFMVYYSGNSADPAAIVDITPSSK